MHPVQNSQKGGKHKPSSTTSAVPSNHLLNTSPMPRPCSIPNDQAVNESPNNVTFGISRWDAEREGVFDVDMLKPYLLVTGLIDIRAVRDCKFSYWIT